MNIFKAKTTLLIIFADNSCDLTDPNYYKILLDENKKIIEKPIGIFTESVEKNMKDSFEEYLKISYDWPLKQLSDCRKRGDEIEITYCCKMPFIRDGVKNGTLVNIKEFNTLYTEDYYGKIISSTPTRVF